MLKVTTLKPKPNKTMLKPPQNLKAAGKKIWFHITDLWNLEEHDLVLLASFCETLDRKNQGEKDLKAHGGLTFTNRYGELKPHPCVAIIRDCNTTLARLRRELCLSEDEPEDRRPPRLRYGGKK